MSLTYHTVDSLCGSVDLTMPTPLIDMSHVTFIEPFALIYLGMFISHHNNRGLYFEVEPPQSEKVKDYLDSQNFWKRCNIRTPRRPHAPMTVAQLTSFNDIVHIKRNRNVAEDIENRVQNLLWASSFRLDISLVVELVGELVDNFARHFRLTDGSVCGSALSQDQTAGLRDRGLWDRYPAQLIQEHLLSLYRE